MKLLEFLFVFCFFLVYFHGNNVLCSQCSEKFQWKWHLRHSFQKVLGRTSRPFRVTMQNILSRLIYDVSDSQFCPNTIQQLANSRNFRNSAQLDQNFSASFWFESTQDITYYTVHSSSVADIGELSCLSGFSHTYTNHPDHARSSGGNSIFPISLSTVIYSWVASTEACCGIRIEFGMCAMSTYAQKNLWLQCMVVILSIWPTLQTLLAQTWIFFVHPVWEEGQFSISFSHQAYSCLLPCRIKTVKRNWN